MAEILGLIASVINVLEGVNKTRVFLQANIHTASSLRAELVPLLGWFTSFEGLLRGLQLECELDESNHGRLNVLQLIVEPLTACEKALQTIIPRLNRSIRLAKWSLSFGHILDKDTSAALRILYQAKPLLDLALLADQSTLLKSVEIYVRTVAEDVRDLRAENQNYYHRIKTEFQVQRALQRQGDDCKDHAEILKWISQIDYRSNLKAALRHVLPNDAVDQWFFQHGDYINWTSSTDDYRSIILVGQSGAGKTVISAKVIESLIRHQKIKSSFRNEVLYYFFDFNDSAKQNAEGMTRSIVHQICSQLPEVPDIVLQLYRRERNARSSPVPITINNWLGVLKTLLAVYSPHFLILDALDECKDTEHALLETFLEELSKANHLSVRWMATRRRSYYAWSPERTQLDADGLNICQIRMEASLVDGDIRAYLCARLETAAGLLSFNSLTKDLIVTKILERSNGMFRYAQCQLDSLSRLKDRRLKQVAETLSRMPADIFDTYSRMLAGLQTANEQTLASRVLLFICYSARPVSLQEVSEFAILEDDMSSVGSEDRFGDPMDVLLLVGSLVDNTHGILSLSHRSVQEYLVSGPGNRVFSCSEDMSNAFNSIENANTYIGRRCLQYIGFGHQWNRDICNEKRANSKHLTKLLDQYPLLDYAATRWPYHLSKRTVQIQLGKQIRSTLPLTAAPNLWKAYVLLLPADIWENQVVIGRLLCEASLRSAVAYEWSCEFWTNRQQYRVSHDSTTKHAHEIPIHPEDYTVKLGEIPESSASKENAFHRSHVAARRFIGRALKSCKRNTRDGNVKMIEGQILVVTATEDEDKWTATTEHDSGNIDSTDFERGFLQLPAVMGVPFYHLAILLLEIALQKPMPKGTSSFLDNVLTEQELQAYFQSFEQHVRDASQNMGQKYGDLISQCLGRVTIMSDHAILRLYQQMVAVMEIEGKDLSLIAGCALELFISQDAAVEELYLPLHSMVRGGFRASRQIKSSDLTNVWIQKIQADTLEREEHASELEQSKTSQLLLPPPVTLNSMKSAARSKYDPGAYLYTVAAARGSVPLHYKPIQQISANENSRWSEVVAPYPTQKSRHAEVSRRSAR